MRTKAKRTGAEQCTFHARTIISGLLFIALGLLAQSQRLSAAEEPDAVILDVSRTNVVVLRAGAPFWDPARRNQPLEAGARIRTGPKSQATIQLTGRSVVRLGQNSLLEIPPQRGPSRAVKLLKGILHYFHRDQPGTTPVETPSIYAIIVGTEFVVQVDDNETTTIQLIDGVVNMTNEFGGLLLSGTEAGLAEKGQPPKRTPSISTINAVQWCLYYPGVLHLDDLDLGVAEMEQLRPSLLAYLSGDLRDAVEKYPAGRVAASEAERVYLAALLLAAGQVDEAEQLLSSAAAEPGSRAARLADALRQVVAVVKLEPKNRLAGRQLTLATEWLAESYWQQSRRQLDEALASARRATSIAPNFAFGWTRVAELEFGFGRVAQARRALNISLGFAPRNAQAVALQGFLYAAANRTRQAHEFFEQAIALDGGLGNAWLGRGLCRIRGGDIEGGRNDLQVAATVEPQRAIFRSYLGKAFQVAGDTPAAERELMLAQELDPADPTAWLYAALLNQQESRINEAIRDLERSQDLVANRAVYRSELLRDQDRAVRGANLAAIYRDANMTDVSLREAVQAVNTDYANYSAHLFLANSYHELRDPNQINLRYETPWLSEYLVANLLAPVAAGTLSQTVSQQEYSRFFERRRFGVVGNAEYLSRGDWTLSGAQFGTLETFGYAVEAFYKDRNGQRINDDQELLTLSVQVKEQITAQDTLFLQPIYYKADQGDLAQYYDPASANPDLRVKERQEPLFLTGYHHEWNPGSHTLFLAGRLDDTLEVSNPQQDILIMSRTNPQGQFDSVVPATIEQTYQNELEVYTTEVQQILQGEDHTLIAGGRYQWGEYDTMNQHRNSSFLANDFPTDFPDIGSDFQRASGYAYWHWHVVPSLTHVVGVSYDWLKYPRNFRFAPLESGEETAEQMSPKWGVIWRPFSQTTFRAGYAQSLGGVSFDQSFRLEPTQVAGFNQAWRSIIPESVAGANSAARFENWGLSLEQKLPTETYLGVTFDLLQSEVDRTVGVYELTSPFFPPFLIPPFDIEPVQTQEHLDYEEQTIAFTVNQLIGRDWSVGGRYRLSRAKLNTDLVEVVPSPSIPAGSNFRPQQDLESILHQVNLYVVYNHPAGFFGQVESAWYQQSNRGYQPDRPGDDFWQWNAFVGYRFPQRRVELRLGLLNITDQDYRLNPLNLTAELPRDRTLLASARFSF